MIDIGKTYNNEAMPVEVATKKKHYPSLRVEKNLGDYEVGDTVYLVAKAKVSAIREDEYGYSCEFQVKELEVKEKTAKDVVDKAAAKMLD